MNDESLNAHGTVDGGTPGAAVERLALVIGQLRKNCLWTAALTHQSLMKYLVEETQELVDVVEAEGPLDTAQLKGELADVLYQIVLHAELAKERGDFDLGQVADALREKLVRRNTHIFFADGSLRNSFPDSIAEIESSYEANKSAESRLDLAESGESEAGNSAAIFASLPKGLPALSLAAKSLDRVEGRASLADVAAASDTEKAEFGLELFDLVRRARSRGVDPEQALRNEIRKYQAGHGSETTTPR